LQNFRFQNIKFVTLLRSSFEGRPYGVSIFVYRLNIDTLEAYTA
jgi:hypothetical protein